MGCCNSGKPDSVAEISEFKNIENIASLITCTDSLEVEEFGIKDFPAPRDVGSYALARLSLKAEKNPKQVKKVIMDHSSELVMYLELTHSCRMIYSMLLISRALITQCNQLKVCLFNNNIYEVVVPLMVESDTRIKSLALTITSELNKGYSAGQKAFFKLKGGNLLVDCLNEGNCEEEIFKKVLNCLKSCVLV